MAAPEGQEMAEAPQQMDMFGPAITVKQEFAALEMFGCEAKNRYRVHRSTADPNDKSVTVPNTQSFFMTEESACFERIICGPQRTLTLMVHEGHGVEGKPQGKLMYKMHKPFHLQGGYCCCRPSLEISDADGNPLGKIQDPFACCQINQRIYDAAGNERFYIGGCPCQMGFCCPCFFDIKFDIFSKQSEEKGVVSKLFDGAMEIFCGTNKFKCTFPKDATENDKVLLMGATMLLDLQYFEQKKDGGGVEV